jgi:hypothetical protein
MSLVELVPIQSIILNNHNPRHIRSNHFSVNASCLPHLMVKTHKYMMSDEGQVLQIVDEPMRVSRLEPVTHHGDNSRDRCGTVSV